MFLFTVPRDSPCLRIPCGLCLHLHLHLKNVVANFVDLRLWMLQKVVCGFAFVEVELCLPCPSLDQFNQLIVNSEPHSEAYMRIRTRNKTLNYRNDKCMNVSLTTSPRTEWVLPPPRVARITNTQINTSFSGQLTLSLLLLDTSDENKLHYRSR